MQIEHIKTPLLLSQGRKIRGTTLICTSFTALTQLLRSPYTAVFSEAPVTAPASPITDIQTGHSQGNFGNCACAKLTAGDFVLCCICRILLSCSSCYQGNIQFNAYYSTNSESRQLRNSKAWQLSITLRSTKNTHTIWYGYFFNRQLSILPGRFQPSTFDV